MTSRPQHSRCAKWVRLLAAGALALTLASCDKCGDFMFGQPKPQACKGETAPR